MIQFIQSDLSMRSNGNALLKFIIDDFKMQIKAIDESVETVSLIMTFNENAKHRPDRHCVIKRHDHGPF